MTPAASYRSSPGLGSPWLSVLTTALTVAPSIIGAFTGKGGGPHTVPGQDPAVIQQQLALQQQQFQQQLQLQQAQAAAQTKQVLMIAGVGGGALLVLTLLTRGGDDA